MMLALKIVVAIIVFFVLVLLIGLLLLRHFIRKFLGALATANVPDRIHLVRQDSLGWENRETVDQSVQALFQLGFQDAGGYTVQEMPGLKLQGFANVSEALYGVVYEQAPLGVWVDVVTGYEDGGSLTCSNAPRGHELDHRPGHDKIYGQDMDAHGLYQRMVSERLQKAVKPANASQFAIDFERGYAEEMEWRKQRGVTPDEVARVAQSGQESSEGQK
ncbi:MAG: hypothetical protein HYU36_10510 [Planctomycetes bacterium]|nr:hypothetical protein [Planctomycetota bacterium]